VLFTLFICLGAGTFAGTGLLTVLGKGEKLQIPAVIVSVVAVVIGGFASFTHLQHWDRLFNGFGSPTSGITQELIGIVVFVILAVVFFVVARKGKAPVWAGALALIVGIGLVVVMAQSYMMPARPVWSTPLLHLFYLAQAVVAGGAMLWLLGSVTKAEDGAQVVNARITAIGGILVVVSLFAYVAYVGSVNFPTVGNYFDPTDPTKPMVDNSGFVGALLSGGLAAYFWIAVVIGGTVAAVLGILQWNKPKGAAGLAAVALVCALGGGIAFRAALYLMGASVYAFY
jgi:anaerobic dimethyl sulfoxide reductase subunit C (anchor subunit)